MTSPAAIVEPRLATAHDLAAVHRVRLAVRENRLTTTVVTRQDYLDAIGRDGRGWVVERDGCVVGFVIALKRTGSIWALFVDPAHEGSGLGGRLLDTAMAWLWEQGLERVWLNTEPGTRAEGFYRARGWVQTGSTDAGEVLFERRRPRLRDSDEPGPPASHRS